MSHSSRLPFSVNDKKSYIPLFKIHSDVRGPAPVASNQRFRYSFFLFLDDCTRFTWIYPLRRKSYFLKCFLSFQRMVENRFDRKMKIYQCDGRGEFAHTDFLNQLDRCDPTGLLSWRA